jgi:hypothetical protein
MHIVIAIAVVVAFIAAVAYLRHHAAIAAKVEADAQKLKNTAEQEARKVEAAVEGEVTKVEHAL